MMGASASNNERNFMQRNQGYQNAYGSGSMKDLAKGSSNNANGFNGQATQAQKLDPKSSRHPLERVIHEIVAKDFLSDFPSQVSADQK